MYITKLDREVVHKLEKSCLKMKFHKNTEHKKQQLAIAQSTPETNPRKINPNQKHA